VLLLRRTQAAPEGQPFWQSVTGSKDSEDEDWQATAVREVPRKPASMRGAGCVLQDWASRTSTPSIRTGCTATRRASAITGACVRPARADGHPRALNPREHTAHAWHDWREAAELLFFFQRRGHFALPPSHRMTVESTPSPEKITASGIVLPPSRILRVATYNIHKGVQGLGPRGGWRFHNLGLRWSSSMPTSSACRKCAR
jgi:dATP pyrophosphohydrolase